VCREHARCHDERAQAQLFAPALGARLGIAFFLDQQDDPPTFAAQAPDHHVPGGLGPMRHRHDRRHCGQPNLNLAKYHFRMLPVVDVKDNILGVIR
jgi:hypothetical protein